jgi:hypothetical protein
MRICLLLDMENYGVLPKAFLLKVAKPGLEILYWWKRTQMTGEHNFCILHNGLVPASGYPTRPRHLDTAYY